MVFNSKFFVGSFTLMRFYSLKYDNLLKVTISRLMTLLMLAFLSAAKLAFLFFHTLCWRLLERKPRVIALKVKTKYVVRSNCLFRFGTMGRQLDRARVSRIGHRCLAAHLLSPPRILILFHQRTAECSRDNILDAQTKKAVAISQQHSKRAPSSRSPPPTIAKKEE